MNSKFWDKKHWFQPKSYLHFSKPLGFEDFNRINKCVIDKKFISRYSFYPLIHRIQIQPRYKKIVDKSGKVYRSHFNYAKNESTKKIRHIFYANHLDSQIYSYYAKEVLTPLYENLLVTNPDFSNCITAYRFIPQFTESKKGKSNIHFAQEVFKYIKKQESCSVLCFDIESFFDNLNHKHLKTAWCELIGEEELPKDHYNIYKSLTNFSYVEETSLKRELKLDWINNGKILKQICNEKGISSYYANVDEFKKIVVGNHNLNKKPLIKRHPFNTSPLPNEKSVRKGIPQGSAISAFLANLYLLEFDKEIYSLMQSVNGLYRRYSDDIICICDTNDEIQIKKSVEKAISKYSLTLNEKVDLVRFSKDKSDTLKYLGFEFDGENIFLKSASLSKYYRKCKRLIQHKAYCGYKLQRKKVSIHTHIYRKKIYRRYTHLGTQNYLSYAFRASGILKSSTIRKQLRMHWKKVHLYMNKWSSRFNLTQK